MFNEQMIQSSAIAEIAITYIKSKKVPAASKRDAFLRVRDQPAETKNS